MAVLALVSRAIWRHRMRSLVVLAVVGGIGLGIVRTAVAAAQRAVAAATGIVNHPVVPVALVAAAIVGVVLVANLLAFVMERPLARTAPAVALRTE